MHACAHLLQLEPGMLHELVLYVLLEARNELPHLQGQQQLLLGVQPLAAGVNTQVQPCRARHACSDSGPGATAYT